MVISYHPHTHEHNQCISRAKTRFVDRLRELGKSIGINDEPVLRLLPIKHRAFSAYNIAGTLSGSEKRIQPIQIYRSFEKLIALGVVHRIATKNSFIACFEVGKCKASQFLI